LTPRQAPIPLFNLKPHVQKLIEAFYGIYMTQQMEMDGTKTTVGLKMNFAAVGLA